MIEPDNDDAFHELVRKRMADYRPPFEPGNWHQMHQKLHRAWWQHATWGITSTSVLVVGIVWYGLSLRAPATSSKQLKSTIKPETVAVVSPVPIQTPESIQTPGSTVETSLPVHDNFAFEVPAVTPSTPRPTETENRQQLLSLAPRPVTPLSNNRTMALPPVIAHNPAEADIIDRVKNGIIGPDSTTYQVFSRNVAKWPNSVVVCDFTSSMYLYSTQLMAWFQRNQTNKEVQGIVFFTDCDSLGRETGPNGGGQLFATRDQSVQQVMPLMLASARNTMGNVNDAENNIEALVYAQRQFPDASHLILIADNSSTVKDLARLPELHKPVHIILCGPTYDTARAFQPDYYAIAKQTGGSLHTLNDDLALTTQPRPSTWLEVDRRYYRLNRRGRFVLTSFKHRPQRLLGLFWR